MNHEKASNHYECWEDTFRIKLKFNEKSKRYSLTVALIETLCKEYHITITKSGLCEKTLMKYLTPFFEWEKRYPIIMAEKEKIERERELKHNNEKYWRKDKSVFEYNLRKDIVEDVYIAINKQYNLLYYKS